MTLNQRVQGSKSLCAHQKHKYLSSLFDGAPDAVFALFGCPHSVHESERPWTALTPHPRSSDVLTDKQRRTCYYLRYPI